MKNVLILGMLLAVVVCGCAQPRDSQGQFCKRGEPGCGVSK